MLPARSIALLRNTEHEIRLLTHCSGMGKRPRHHNGHRSSSNHHSKKGNRHAPVARHPTVKHKTPKDRILHGDGKNGFVRERKVMKDPVSLTSPSNVAESDDPFSSRKRSLTKVEFVYPKKNGVKESYKFGKAAAAC